jgi:hypothetical protein
MARAARECMKQEPKWLVCAAVAVIVEALLLAVATPGFISVAAVGVTVIFALLMLKGSRLAWVLAALSAVGQLVESVVAGDNSWVAPTLSCIAAICLLAPPSFRYIWGPRQDRREFGLPAMLEKPCERARTLAYNAIAVVADWEKEQIGMKGSGQRSYKVLLWRLGFACVSLFFLSGILHGWKNDDGGWMVAVIDRSARIAYVLAQLTFIAAALVAAYRHFSPSRIDATPPTVKD